MIRNPLNSNQELFYEAVFNGMKIQNDKAPLIVDYLNTTYLCLIKSMDQYRRVFMLRFDLHLPNDYPDHLTFDNALMEKFFASLKAKIKHSQATKNGMVLGYTTQICGTSGVGNEVVRVESTITSPFS